MRRDEFLLALAGLAIPGARPRARGADPSLLVPMDARQSNHLKAYGLTYRSLQRGPPFFGQCLS